jgi:hypothetical protein
VGVVDSDGWRGEVGEWRAGREEGGFGIDDEEEEVKMVVGWWREAGMGGGGIVGVVIVLLLCLGEGCGRKSPLSNIN